MSIFETHLEDRWPIPEGGTLIHGTNRRQDLIPTFIAAVKLYNKPGYHGLIGNSFAPDVARALSEPEDTEWWYGQEASILLDDLVELLEDVAPVGLYFGTHPGDGSDWGWWACQPRDADNE